MDRPEIESVMPDRAAMWGGLKEHVIDDGRIGQLMRILEPFFVIAASQRYPLIPSWRLRKSRLAAAIAAATRAEVGGIEWVSATTPVPRLGWMSDDGYQRYRDIGFAQVIRMSTDPWLEVVLKNEYGLYGDERRAEREAAEDLFRASFGNMLHRAINGTLFSGAAYPVEASFVHFLAFALANDAHLTGRLMPLMRLLPRAIPLGVRKGSDGVWNVLVA